MDDAVGALWRMDALTFRYRDPDRRLAGVRLVVDIRVPADLDFGYDDLVRGWRLSVPRPDAWRLEYRLELRHLDGTTEIVCDPDNPRRVGGAFGDRSVAQRPDYVEPAWLRLPGADGSWREMAIPARAVNSDIWARVWSPAGTTDLVLLAHDGPEFDKLAELGHYSAAMVGSGRVPPHHLVLLSPGSRREWYSANPVYARALVRDVLPRLQAELKTVRPVVGMGTSLGGLAMLHAQRRYPRCFAGLFLQSGSFFRPRLDRQESRFPWFRRIVRFTGRVVAADGAPRTVPVVLTCGRVEENLGNNREMARALLRQGYPADLFEVPDAHNFTGWRDAFDPYLTDLLRRVWAPEPSGGR
jgi:enterochelin esterase-like enzyme